MLKVNSKNYTTWDYPPYMERGNQTEAPKSPTYEVGSVAYDKENRTIGVVLGCIDEVCGDLRLDSDGMRPLDQIRLATVDDFNLPGVRFSEKLKKEIFAKPKGFKTLDDIRDFSITVVDSMVKQGYIKDCTDTDDDTEFSVQDIITQELCEKTGIEFE